jgi:hypothetical protein
VLGHVLERPGKRSLTQAAYVDVQQSLFNSYGAAVGALEMRAQLTTAAWCVRGWLFVWLRWPTTQ